MKKRVRKKQPKGAKKKRLARAPKRTAKPGARKKQKRTTSKVKAVKSANHQRASRLIQRALDRFSKAQMGLSARGVEVLSVAHAIESSAVEKFKRKLLASLVRDDILQDLHSLHDALSQQSSQHAATSEALLNWLSGHFDLKPHLRSGQILDLPADQLSQFTLLEEIESVGVAMVRLEVVHPGWKASGKLVVAPALKRAAASQPSQTADAELTASAP
jgi:hypothetical protein